MVRRCFSNVDRALFDDAVRPGRGADHRQPAACVSGGDVLWDGSRIPYRAYLYNTPQPLSSYNVGDAGAVADLRARGAAAADRLLRAQRRRESRARSCSAATSAPSTRYGVSVDDVSHPVGDPRRGANSATGSGSRDRTRPARFAISFGGSKSVEVPRLQSRAAYRAGSVQLDVVGPEPFLAPAAEPSRCCDGGNLPLVERGQAATRTSSARPAERRGGHELRARRSALPEVPIQPVDRTDRSQRRRPRPPLIAGRRYLATPRPPAAGRAPRPTAVCRSASTAGWLCRRGTAAAAHIAGPGDEAHGVLPSRRAAPTSDAAAARAARRRTCSSRRRRSCRLGTAGSPRPTASTSRKDPFEFVRNAVARAAAVTGEARADHAATLPAQWHLRVASPRSWSARAASRRGAAAAPILRIETTMHAALVRRIVVDRAPQPPDHGRRRQDDPHLAASAGAARARASAADRRRLRGPHLRARAHTRRQARSPPAAGPAGSGTGRARSTCSTPTRASSCGASAASPTSSAASPTRRTVVISRSACTPTAGCWILRTARLRDRSRATRSTATRSSAPTSAPTGALAVAALDGQVRLYDREFRLLGRKRTAPGHEAAHRAVLARRAACSR